MDVAVIGELNPDLILYGLPRELAEERESLASDFTLTLGSSAAIFAHNLALLGNRVSFSSQIGRDAMGQMCCEYLHKAGVDTSRVVFCRSGTGVSVILPLETTRRILTYPGAMHEIGFADLDLEFLAQAKHLHLASPFLLKKLFPDISRLLIEMKQRGLTTSLDTNDDPEGRWEGLLDEVLPTLDVLLCTEEELGKLAKVNDASAYIAARVPVLVVKRGARGAKAYQGRKTVEAPALSVEVVDPVGAGDSFDAGFLHQWIRQAPLEICVRFGNVAGALSVTRPGGIEAFAAAAYRESFIREHWQSAPPAGDVFAMAQAPVRPLDTDHDK